MNKSHRFFVGTLNVRIASYDQLTRYLIVANSHERAVELFEKTAAGYYGEGDEPKADGGYYANGGEVHVSANGLLEIGLAAFQELARFLPVRYDDTVPRKELDLEATAPEGFKALAKSLANRLARQPAGLGYSGVLDMLSGAFGVKNWQVLAAKLAKMEAEEEQVVPDPVHPEPVDFEVEVCRTGYGVRDIRVKARCRAEAAELALDEAGSHLYDEHTADYQAMDVRQV